VNKKAEFSDGIPPVSVVAMNKKSASVTSEIFMDWLENHFAPRKPAGKTLLILYGHASHLNCYKMLEFAMKNDIVLLCLPRHTTHYTQPLDRSSFKPLKTYFYQSFQIWILINEKLKVTRLQFGKILCHAWSRATTTAPGAAGFRAAGIFPSERSEIPDHAFVLSESSSCIDRPHEPEQRSTSPQPSRTTSLNDDVQSIMESKDHVNAPSTPNKVLQQVSPIPQCNRPTDFQALGGFDYRRVVGCHCELFFFRSLSLLPAYKTVVVRLL
jgi:hypothetical protein